MSNYEQRRTGGNSQPDMAFPRSFVWLLVLSVILGWLPARADEKEDEYLRIYDMVQEADALGTKGKTGPALAKYTEAQKALRSFKLNHPEWNPKSISYRSKYVAERIAALSEKSSGSAATAPPGGAGEGQGTAAGDIPGSVVQIKLLEAGAEPRKALRWHPKAGDKQKLGIATKLAMGMKVGEMENPPMKIPGMKFTMELTVKEISAEGLMTYDTVISDAGVVEDPDAIPQFAATIKSAMDSIKGMSGTGMMSNRGESKGIEFKVPANTEPQARQTMDQMKEITATLTTPLPEEAIGLGAKWEARTKVKSQGMSIDQTTTYQLVSMEGERATIKSAMAQQATNQKIENPAMPGLKVDMTKMEGKGSGNIVCDFAQVLPVSGTIESHSDALMAMDLGAQKQVMNMKMDVTITLESK